MQGERGTFLKKSSSLPLVSLRLGHARVLPPHCGGIHCAHAASLPLTLQKTWKKGYRLSRYYTDSLKFLKILKKLFGASFLCGVWSGAHTSTPPRPRSRGCAFLCIILQTERLRVSALSRPRGAESYNRRTCSSVSHRIQRERRTFCL